MWWQKKDRTVSQQFLEKQLTRAYRMRRLLDDFNFNYLKNPNHVVTNDLLIELWDTASLLEDDLAYLKERLK